MSYNFKQQSRQFQEEADASRQAFGSILDRLDGQYSDAMSEAGATKEDVYGEELRRISDKAKSTANNTKQALSRAVASAGGDITGEAAVQMSKADSQANSAIARSEDLFDEKFRRYKDRQENQALRILGQQMQGEGTLMQTAQNSADRNQMLQLQKEQFEKQLNWDKWATGIDALTRIGTAFIPG